MVASTEHAAMHPAIAVPIDAIATWSRKWGVREVALFGSVLRKDFRPDSDVDVMIRLHDGVQRGLWDWGQMEDELKEIFSRDVDLLSRRGVEISSNPIRKKAMLDSARIIYVEG